jgi:hypothetical protein
VHQFLTSYLGSQTTHEKSHECTPLHSLNAHLHLGYIAPVSLCAHIQYCPSLK